MQKKISHHLWLAGILVFATVLRVVIFKGKGLWLDEAYTVNFAHMPFMEIVRKLTNECTPPLYYLLLKGWSELFGWREDAVRGLSLIFSVGTIAFVCMLARRFFSLTESIIVGALLSVLPFAVYYAGEVRMYAFFIFASVALLYFAMSFVVTARRVYLAGITCAALVLVLTHTVGVWFVAALFFAGLFMRFSRQQTIGWTTAFVIAGFAYVPWFLVTIKQLGRQATVLAWYVPFWNAETPIFHFFASIKSFFYGPYPVYNAFPVRTFGGVASAFVALGLMGWGVWRSQAKPAIKLIAITGVLSVLLALAYSQYLQPIYIPGRTDAYLFPIVILLTTVGICSMPKRWMVITLTSASIVLSVPVLYGLAINKAKDGSREYLRKIDGKLKEGDLVIATGYSYAAAIYYLEICADVPDRVESFPLSMKEHPGYFNEDEYRENMLNVRSDARDLFLRMRQTVLRGNTVYLILTPHSINQELTDTLKNIPNIRVLPFATGYESLLKTPLTIITATRPT